MGTMPCNGETVDLDRPFMPCIGFKASIGFSVNDSMKYVDVSRIIVQV